MAKTVLLLEDDADIRALAAEVLAGEGYRVLEAAGLPEAERLLGEGGIDLLLADSPSASRAGAAAWYRGLCPRLGGRVRVMAFSAHAFTPEELRGFGCAGSLPKPFDLDGLVAAVRAHTGG